MYTGKQQHTMEDRLLFSRGAAPRRAQRRLTRIQDGAPIITASCIAFTLPIVNIFELSGIPEPGMFMFFSLCYVECRPTEYGDSVPRT